jgi:hypothetical protein
MTIKGLNINNKILEKKIELLKVLAKGCKKHPAYRAIRKATGRCEECVIVWNTRLELNDLDNS